MTYVNKLIAIGRVGKINPMKTFDNGDKAVRFTIACNKRYTSSRGDVVEQTKWWSLLVRNSLAELASSRLKIGDTVYIEGEPVDREYTDRDGNKAVSTEVAVQIMQFVSMKLGVPEENVHSSNPVRGDRMTAPPNQQNARPQKPALPDAQSEDDLPF